VASAGEATNTVLSSTGIAKLLWSGSRPMAVLSLILREKGERSFFSPALPACSPVLLRLAPSLAAEFTPYLLSPSCLCVRTQPPPAKRGAVQSEHVGQTSAVFRL
jgi:hypothetical protein